MTIGRGLKDGLGGDEVIGNSGTGLPTQDAFLTGSLTVGGQISGLNIFGAGSLIGANVNAGTISTSITGSFTGSAFAGVLSTPKNTLLTMGSPYGYGLAIQLTARSNVSGGMWVTASGGLAIAGPASAQTPIGVSQPGTNVASGGTVNVIIKGVVPMTAEGTIVYGNGVMPGAGAGLNAVQPMVAGSTNSYATLDSAASGTTTQVFVVL